MTEAAVGSETEADVALERPRLRPVAPEWIVNQGEQLLLLRDPLRLTEAAVAVPRAAAALLSLFDGERDLPAIASGFALRTGGVVTVGELRQLVRQLDDTLLLDSPRYQAARREAARQFRAAPARPPALAGRVYPADPAALTVQLDGWLDDARRRAPAATADPDLRGIICPHIDYGRGAPIYADVWLRAAAAVRAADVILIFGTDHHGRAGSITPTPQRYATPLGPLATDQRIVEAVAATLGEDTAYAEELHHRDEHSVELAVVWVQHLLGAKPTPVIPLLTGSFFPFTDGSDDAGTYAPFARALAAIREATAGRRVLVVAAADLAHMGPAFGDPRPLTIADKRRAKLADGQLLAALSTGSAEAFLEPISAERDARRICGVSPIYLTLRLLEQSSGVVTSYDQCPADAAFGSLVSIAGVLLR